MNSTISQGNICSFSFNTFTQYLSAGLKCNTKSSICNFYVNFFLGIGVSFLIFGVVPDTSLKEEIKSVLLIIQTGNKWSLVGRLLHSAFAWRHSASCIAFNVKTQQKCLPNRGRHLQVKRSFRAGSREIYLRLRWPQLWLWLVCQLSEGAGHKTEAAGNEKAAVLNLYLF